MSNRVLLRVRALRRTGWCVAAALLAGSLPLAASTSSGASVPKPAPTYQFGISTYFTYGCELPATVAQWEQTEINQFVALGANSIAIAFPLYTDSVTSNDVFAALNCTTYQYQTPPVAMLASFVELAHAAGLHVFLRPLLDQANLYLEAPGDWRGVLDPTNLTQWMQNYLTTLRPFLVMAQQQGVEHFALTTELNSLASFKVWSSSIALTKSVYRGDLVWTYSWNTPVHKQTHPFTSFGIDAYPVMGPKVPPTASAKQLLAGWNRQLNTGPDYRVPRIKATGIDEIGLAAQDGAYQLPYKGAIPTSTFNPLVQANWFTAACRFMKQHTMKGIYFWGQWLSQNDGSFPTTPTAASPTQIQPAGQLAIQKCFAPVK
jgi:hypothetical protein